MSVQDLINDLERRVSTLSREMAGLPVRWAGGGGAGGAGDSTLGTSLFIVSVEVTAATWDGATLTPGSGNARSCTVSSETGHLTVEADELVVYNYDPGEVYEVGTGVEVSDSAVEGAKKVVCAWCGVLNPWPPSDE